jgi:hypothetical protein
MKEQNHTQIFLLEAGPPRCLSPFASIAAYAQAQLPRWVPTGVNAFLSESFYSLGQTWAITSLGMPWSSEPALL